MKKVLLVHSLIEIIAGIILIFSPDLLLMSDDQALETLIVAKLYGILALTFGAISFMLYKTFRYTDTLKKIILMIMFFHVMVSFQMYAAYSQGTIPNLGAFGIHMIIAVLFFVSYMIEINNFTESKSEIES